MHTHWHGREIQSVMLDGRNLGGKQLWPLVFSSRWSVDIITCRHKNIHHQLHEEICSDCLARARWNETPRHGSVSPPHETPIVMTSSRNSRRGSAHWSPGSRAATCGGWWRCRSRCRSCTCRHWTSLSAPASGARDPRTCTRTRTWPGAGTRARTDAAEGSLSVLRSRICGTDWLVTEWILTEE